LALAGRACTQPSHAVAPCFPSYCVRADPSLLWEALTRSTLVARRVCPRVHAGAYYIEPERAWLAERTQQHMLGCSSGPAGT